MLRRRDAWLSITPEPERELPAAIATLRAGHEPDRDCVERERARVERLVVCGSQREWLRYLTSALALAERAGTEEAVAPARALVLDVVRNHHQLLLGLPGRAAERTAGERARLDAIDNGGHG
jgi:hypothetical protein